MQKKLWDEAVELILEFSVLGVFKTLKVNHARLKELAEPKLKPDKLQNFVKLEIILFDK